LHLKINDPYLAGKFMELKEATGGTTDDVMRILFGWEPRVYLKAPEPPGDEFPVNYSRVSASSGQHFNLLSVVPGKTPAIVKWAGRGNHWNITLTSTYGTGRLRVVEFNGELTIVDARIVAPPLRVDAYAKFADWMVRRLLVMADDLCSRLGCRGVLVEPEFLGQYPVVELFTRRSSGKN